MDDFRTWLSSLSNLRKYGFERINTEKSFLQALDEAQEKSKQLIDAIVLLGSRLGISITAEGVETDDQRDILNKLGCNVLQDYLFGKPAPMQLDIGAKRQTSNL